MEYGIRELSQVAGVSARTLRYYDQIGLLKPSYTSEAGYRFYREEQVELLQQILFYRARGFALREINEILHREDFDVLTALEDHLLELERQRVRTERLIQTVRHTIASMKGEYAMSDNEKFEALKEKLVQENEARYGEEVRKRYGDEVTEGANRKMLAMTEEDYKRFRDLEFEIASRLEELVQSGAAPESQEGRQVVELHREWLCMTWKNYTKEAHKGIAATYAADERFKAYYDKNVPGCAGFLQKAVEYWTDVVN